MTGRLLAGKGHDYEHTSWSCAATSDNTQIYAGQAVLLTLERQARRRAEHSGVGTAAANGSNRTVLRRLRSPYINTLTCLNGLY
jgi:hypothetical protein